MDINNFDWGWMENPEVTDLKPLLIKEVFEDRIYERFFTILAKIHKGILFYV